MISTFFQRDYNILAIGSLVNFLLSFFIGLFVFIKNRRAKLNRRFFYMTLCVGGWALFMFMWSSEHLLEKYALLGAQMSNLVALFVPVFYLHFVLSLIDKDIEKKKIIIICYLVHIFIFLLAITYPNQFIGGVRRPSFGITTFYTSKPGLVYHVFPLLFFLESGYAIYQMIKIYPHSSAIRKNQIKYAIFSSIIGYVGGGSTFLAVYDIPFFPYPNLFFWLWSVILAYSIIRYRLMEIDTVIHRTLLWILTLLLVILPVGLAVTLSMDWMTSLSRLAKLALTSVVLIFFVWYYSKLKPRVDHFFRRRKYDYYQVLGEIGQKIGSELDINNVVSRLFKELKDVLYIRSGLALVQQPGQLNYTEAGNIGYESLLESHKAEKAALDYQSSLSQWLQTRQKALEREQVEVDPQYEPIKQESLSFLNQNSIEVLIPVVMENKVNALVGIGKKENLQAYTIKDIELLENMGRQIGITIDNAMHHEDIVEKERLAEEMKLGREIQMNLLPREIPQISGLTVQGLMQPAKEIGGDYYDFITLPDEDKLSIVIGDVSGKGVAAGLLMAMAKTAIHTLSQEEVSPKQILLRTNSILSQHIGGQKFMTLLYFIWQPQTKTLTYSSAGHEHILVYRPSPSSSQGGESKGEGKVESILSGGFMLGMVPDISNFLEDKQITLKPGDKVILYTDGVTEARNTQEDFFGLQKLIQSIEKYGSKPANELLQSLKDEVYSFIGTREQYDDITLVVMEAK